MIKQFKVVILAVKGKVWTFNYDKQKDGTNKQMRDVWNMPLCQGKERLRDEDEQLHSSRINYKKEKSYTVGLFDIENRL